ncbi:MAG: cytochrome c-type biogenesis protein CcmH [Solirubrobacteraceae bacterium]|nr:cytochrome c-type biogenesis protein CcmH [Solirubrobacteraceae bacterium]
MTSLPARLGHHLVAGLLALVLALAVLPASVASAQADRGARADLVDIEDEVMCIVCERPLSTSGGDAADDQRSVIQGFIDEGLTKQQVKDRLVAEYGEKVLVEGSSPIAAVAPVLAALVGGVSIWLLLRRRFRTTAREDDADAGVSGDGGAPAPADAAALPEPTAEDDARIDAELSER